MRQLFGRFVPDQVVEQAMDRSPGQLREASRLDATVLFSDLRGFTSFSEALPAEQVTDVLNRYLTEMSTAIAANGGTVVSYMGDGIMAVFGAPIPAADHADRALTAAREMLTRLERFNAEIREDGLGDGFRMGVGLNSGPVMSGNVGSEDRLEYTAIGDTTNTAARLEAMTKDAGCSVLVADSTKQRLREAPEDLVEVGDTAVRGRRDAVRLWSID